MATKAAHTQFNRSVAAYLQSIGAEFELRNGISGKGIVKTFAGDLLIELREPERIEVFSVFSKFPNEPKFCNFHSYDPKELLEEFKEQITPLLIKTLTT